MVPTSLNTFAHEHMSSIAIPIAPVNTQQNETYSNVEANTYDFLKDIWNNKWFLRVCIHLPMEICAQLQFLLIPYTNKQIETYSNVEANTYDFEKMEQTVVPTSLHTSAHGKYVLNYNSY